MTLERLALSRSTLDRAAERRDDPDLLPRLLADPATRVLVVSGDRAPIEAPHGAPGQTDGPGRADGVRLALRAAPDLGALVTDPELIVLASLGRTPDGVEHLLLALPAPGEGAEDAARPVLAGPPPERWAVLREVGTLLDDTDAGLMVAAVALANWHAAHPRCSRCGAPTDAVQAGWSRRCTACGAPHFPRTDPAVIMAVVDPDDRILLGHQALWPAKRFSTLAGFVEPGESLEAAVRREVLEEAGVRVGAVSYRGSQPWPFPSSLMLAFRAEAVSSEPVVDGVELAEARWWTRADLARDVTGEDLLLPPPLSVARQLIEEWYGGPITDGGGAWR